MNSFDTLIFPDTDIFNEKNYPLLLFFSPLHFLKLVEAGINSDIDDEFTLFSKRGLCQAHTPAPLDDSREQFLHLIRDIKERKEHYLTQLSKLTNASMQTVGNGKVTHSQHKISSLLQEYGLDHASSDKDLKIWQARLVLVLAEILENTEEDLREELSYLDENEIAMLRSLQTTQDSSEENLLDELEIIKDGLKKPRSKESSKRFDAWLLLMKNQPAPSVKMWLASSRDSAEQIFRKYEAITKSHPIPLLKLAFPAHIMASAEYAVQQIEEFHRATITIHQGLVADFDRVTTAHPYIPDVQESLLPYGTDWAEQWEVMLHKHFSASRDGRNHVTFYLLPNQPIAQLLSLPEPAGTRPKVSAAHGLLGILSTS
ncbi:MAG: hypothetical protein WBB23_20000 [Desulforhopalus sp.]